MNRDLLICSFCTALLLIVPVGAQEGITSTLVDDVATLDLTTVEADSPARSVIIRQEAVQQFHTPSVATKTIQRTETEREKNLPAVDTISGAENRTFQRYDLGDILSQSAGVSLIEAGQMGGQTSLFIRGMESNHTVVLLNGRRLPPGLAGIYQLEYLDVSTLESVQITKGAASSLYGSDALAGVIDMHSTDARYIEENTLSSFVEGGSFSTFRTGHKVTLKDGPVTITLDTSILDTANDRPAPPFENGTHPGQCRHRAGRGRLRRCARLHSGFHP